MSSPACSACRWLFFTARNWAASSAVSPPTSRRCVSAFRTPSSSPSSRPDRCFLPPVSCRDGAMFLIVLGMAPVLWTINRHFRVKLSRYSRASQESFSRVTATLAESVNGIRVTQGFVRQQTNAGLFRSLLADHSRYSVDLARTSGILVPLLELNSQFFIAILLLLGGWRTMHGYMQVSDLILFFLMA